MKGCRPLDDAEVRAIAAAFSGPYAARDRAMFLLGVRSGFRISELLSLTVEDIFHRGTVLDRVAVKRRNMKKKIEGRSVILHPEAREALAVWIAELEAAGHADLRGYVFRSRKGENAPIGRIQAWRILNTRYEAGGLTGSLGTHSMRKTFANRVYDRLGHDIIKTQRALGHKSLNSTAAYLSFREADIDAAILAA